eukprot:5605728-Pleurochrysis_carterae.AAC.1
MTRPMRARGRRGGVEAATQEGAAGPQGAHAREAQSSWLGAAGDAQVGQARREARAKRASRRAAKVTARARINALPLHPKA